MDRAFTLTAVIIVFHSIRLHMITTHTQHVYAPAGFIFFVLLILNDGLKKKCINLFSFIEVQCILLATIKPQFILKCSTHQNIAYINEY